MVERGRRQAVAAVVAGIVAVVAGALWVRAGGDDGAPRSAPLRVAGGGPGERADGGGRGARVVVHVAGAVRRPGVYRLRAGTRIAAALRRAGGATARADLDALNLAARVEDGRQVLVPRRVQVGGGGGTGATTGAAAGSGAATGGVGAAPAPGATGPPINLNTATAEQLDTLPGVGPATAAAILAYRQEHGGFGSVDELDQVPGIGPATLEALRDLVSV